MSIKIGYFTCQRQGVFPDTAHCAIGRYFYCPQVYASKPLKKYLFQFLECLILF